MRPGKPVPLADILSHRSGPFAKLDARAADARTLTTLLHETLGPELAPLLYSARLEDDGTLRLTAPDASAATRLRFEGERLVAATREQDARASRFRVRIAVQGRRR